MTVDPATLAAILAMAVVTYATRVAGFFIAGRLVLRGRARAAFDAIPPAVLVAVIAPTALTTGWPETVAALVTILAAIGHGGGIRHRGNPPCACCPWPAPSRWA